MDAINAVESLRELLDTEVDSAGESINTILSAILHTGTALLNEWIVAERVEFPWFDFGPEPMTLAEAQSSLPVFCEALSAILQQSGVPPLGSAAVRMTTYACLPQQDNVVGP